MLLERFVILLSAFIIVSTLVSFIYHEGVLSTTGSGSDGTDSSQHSYHLANTKKFFILNETLSSLKAELQYLRSSKEPISAIRRQPSNPSNITHGEVIVIPSSKIAEERKVDASLPKKAALFFTMDSIRSYESSSRQGGAAGEILVRRSLEKMFLELDIRVDVKASDQEFESADTKAYDFIFVDPWTWAAKGWVPKKNLVGLSEKIFVLDFFGSKKLRGSGLNIPSSRILTAFNTTSENSFLGYYVEEKKEKRSSMVTKKAQGVIWAKENKHLDGKNKLLESVADNITLLSTSQIDSFHHKNIKWVGHKSPEEWHSLLLESKFLLGLGSPLLGPSAIDAVAAGCMYINPIYNEPFAHNDRLFNSQHPYAVEKVGEPYVCSYKENDFISLQKCVDKATEAELVPYIPYDFTKAAYRQRVLTIFNL